MKKKSAKTSIENEKHIRDTILSDRDDLIERLKRKVISGEGSQDEVETAINTRKNLEKCANKRVNREVEKLKRLEKKDLRNKLIAGAVTASGLSLVGSGLYKMYKNKPTDK